jgi:hypothetical protein
MLGLPAPDVDPQEAGAVRAPLARPAPPRAGGGGDGLKAPLEIFDSSVFDVHRGRGE